HDHGGATALRRLVRHLQSPSAAQRPWLPAARGLRGGVQPTGTLIDGGPINGVRSGQLAVIAGRRYQAVAWPAFGVLVVTGIINVGNAGIQWRHLLDTDA